MKLNMTRLFAIVLCLFTVFGFSLAQARQSESVDTGKVVASLISSHDTVAPGSTVHLALRTELDDGWHTYWRNPGDSGEPVQLSWTLPDGVVAGDIAWPLPYPIPTGPIINYGFEGTPIFPVTMTIPADATPGSILTFDLDFYYLVCADVCIPEDGQTKLMLAVGEPEIDMRWKPDIDAALEASPKLGDVTGAISVAGDVLTAQFTNLPEGRVTDAYFFPFEQGVLGHSNPQALQIGTTGIALTTIPDFAWREDTLPAAFEGVLKYTLNGQIRGDVVQLNVGDVLNIGETRQSSVGGFTLLSAALGAFLGGLILNLMPCVFPIISLKALSLAKTAHGDRAPARRAAWAYTVGVLATFVALALALIAFKAAGAQIGWGFQLQSPKVVGVLAVLLFIIGLNLLGVFEFGGRLQGVGEGLTTRSGLSGSFFTGVLAVIVATPCTAPFMAGAIGYALAQPAAVMLAVFLALGFGFALPFLILGYAPGLLAKLPKPGPWMVRFREFLAFPMFAAAIWLVWVLSLQAGATGVGLVLIAMLSVGFAIWLFQRNAVLAKGLAVLAAIAALLLPLSLSAAPTELTKADLNYEAWSPARVTELRAEGRPVFVDFTAAWCVTCKVNETLVLNTDKTKQLFDDTNTAFLVADWTNRDAVIAAELERYGRAGVPLYLAYPTSHTDVMGIVLPQRLTFDVLKDTLGPN